MNWVIEVWEIVCMCGTTRMKEKKRKKKIKVKKKTAVRKDGHVKKRKPSTFLREYYRILSSALRLLRNPFNSGILLFSSIFFNTLLLFLPFFLV